jgi:hypothetical protein
MFTHFICSYIVHVHVHVQVQVHVHVHVDVLDQNKDDNILRFLFNREAIKTRKQE